jgi:phage gpG-like protein
MDEGLSGLDMINIEVVNLPEVNDSIKSTVGAIRNAIRDEIDNIGAKTVALAKNNVSKKTGRLANAIDYNVTDNADIISAEITVDDVPYAAAQEYGFDGDESVKAYTRHMTQAFGYPVDIEVSVGAYTRHMNIPAQEYLGRAIDQIDNEILDDLITSINDATA